jgi:hypothetical protein
MATMFFFCVTFASSGLEVVLEVDGPNIDNDAEGVDNDEEETGGRSKDGTADAVEEGGVLVLPEPHCAVGGQ